MKPKLLIIGYVWPEPNSSGAGTRMMQLIELFLAQQYAITFATPAVKTEHMADLEALGVATATIEVNSSRFDRFIAGLNPDIVLFDRFMMEEQFGWRVERHCPGALRILESIDLHCLREARHKRSKREQVVAIEVDDSDLFNEIACREIASIYRSDLTLLTSGYEMTLLTERFGVPEALLQYTPFMFDPFNLSEQKNNCIAPSPGFEERQHFVSIGNFRHAPNWDAVLWLKEVIWPLIRKTLPDAELHIYGSYPPKKATALHNAKEGFHLQGWAEDPIRIMQQARISLAPLRFGAGIKGKLADAMLAGTPCVTTSIGAESMHDGLPWCGAIEDDPDRFANAATELYRDPERWQKHQRQCFNIISQLFNKKDNKELIVSRIETLSGDMEQQRQKNFIGSMLRHHHHRSTEFMARWIEEKNRALTGQPTSN